MQEPELFTWLISANVRNPEKVFTKLTKVHEISTVSTLLLAKPVQDALKAKMTVEGATDFDVALFSFAASLAVSEVTDLTVDGSDDKNIDTPDTSYHEFIQRHDDALSKAQLELQIKLVSQDLELKNMLVSEYCPSANPEGAFKMAPVARYRLRCEKDSSQDRLQRLFELLRDKNRGGTESAPTHIETSTAPVRRTVAKKKNVSVHFEQLAPVVGDFPCEGCSLDYHIPPCAQCAAQTQTVISSSSAVKRETAARLKTEYAVYGGLSRDTRSVTGTKVQTLRSSAVIAASEMQVEDWSDMPQLIPIQQCLLGHWNAIASHSEIDSSAARQSEVPVSGRSAPDEGSPAQQSDCTHTITQSTCAAAPLSTTHKGSRVPKYPPMSMLSKVVLKAVKQLKAIPQPDGLSLLAHYFVDLPPKSSDYYQTIAEPIALRDIISTLRHGGYHFLEQVELDLALMASNARTYNMVKAPEIYCDAERLREEFFVRCTAIRAKHGLPPHSNATAPPLPAEGHLIYTSSDSFVCDLSAPTAAHCALATPLQSPLAAELNTAADLVAKMRALECQDAEYYGAISQQPLLVSTLNNTTVTDGQVILSCIDLTKHSGLLIDANTTLCDSHAAASVLDDMQIVSYGAPPHRVDAHEDLDREQLLRTVVDVKSAQVVCCENNEEQRLTAVGCTVSSSEQVLNQPTLSVECVGMQSVRRGARKRKRSTWWL